MVGGSGPHQVDYRDIEGRPLKEVLVSRKCGEAVLRGADVSTTIQIGDICLLASFSAYVREKG